MSFGYRSGNVYFVVELLLAELIFLYPVPKRRAFPARLAAVFAGMPILSAFLPEISAPQLFVLDGLLRFLMIFTMSVLALKTVFQLRFSTLLCMCTAGYAVQHAGYGIGWILRLSGVFPALSLGPFDRNRVLEIVSIAVAYALVLATFGRFSAKNECYRNEDIRFNAVSVGTIFICIGFSRLYGLLGEEATITSCVYSIMCDILALYIQFNLHRRNIEERENAAIQQMWKEEAKQYEITRNAMESINIRLHDLKHKLLGCRGKLMEEEIESLRRDMDAYDTKLETGNEALNVLLYEKQMKCQREGIRLSCSGNFSLLDFMKVMDVYSLFGNAVDNAIEAVEKVARADQRVIGISMEQKGAYLFIAVTNYFDGTLNIQDNQLLTTKIHSTAEHGYGFKSMQLIAKKYGGELAFSTKGNLFSLSIYLKKPQ